MTMRVDFDASSSHARLMPILWVLATIAFAWVFTRWWLYPTLGIPDYAPMLLRPILGFAMAWWLIARDGEHWRDYGLCKPSSWWRLPLQCVLLYASVALTARYVTPHLAGALHAIASPSLISTIGGNEVALMGWLAIGWGVGGFIEELLFRGFLLNRVEAWLGGSRTATAVAVCAQAALFGALHLYQGSFGAVHAAMFALIYGLAYPLFGRNLWPLILVHGLWNSVAIWSAYAG